VDVAPVIISTAASEKVDFNMVTLDFVMLTAARPDRKSAARC
jgi:hypothetical protein